MQRTLIQLKKDFQEIADKHRQINSFFWGDFTDAISQDAVDYPLMVCTLQPTNIGENYVGVDLVVIIADKYNEQDYRVIDEVHNDSLLICKDIEVTLRQFRFSDVLDLETDLTNTPFINRGHDITAGWSMNVRMEVYDYDNPCVIPYDDYDFENGGSSAGCAPATVTLDNTDGTELSVTSVASGSSETIIAPDATYIVQYVDGTLIESGTIASGGSVTVSVPDVITCLDANYTLTDSDGNVLESGTIASGGSATIVAPDANISLNGVSFPSILSGGSDNIEVRQENTSTQVGSKQGQYWRIADSVITLQNTDGTTISTTNVDAENAATIVAPDSQLNVNSVDVGDVVSVKTIDVNLTDGTNPVTPTSTTLVGNTLTIVTPKDLEINIPYLTSDTTSSITILSGSNGVITAADTTGLTTVTYEINAVASTLPLTLAVSDVLTINFDAAAADGVIQLSGTYA